MTKLRGLVVQGTERKIIKNSESERETTVLEMIDSNDKKIFIYLDKVIQLEKVLNRIVKMDVTQNSDNKIFFNAKSENIKLTDNKEYNFIETLMSENQDLIDSVIADVNNINENLFVKDIVEKENQISGKMEVSIIVYSEKLTPLKVKIKSNCKREDLLKFKNKKVDIEYFTAGKMNDPKDIKKKIYYYNTTSHKNIKLSLPKKEIEKEVNK